MSNFYIVYRSNFYTPLLFKSATISQVPYCLCVTYSNGNTFYSYVPKVFSNSVRGISPKVSIAHAYCHLSCIDITYFYRLVDMIDTNVSSNFMVNLNPIASSSISLSDSDENSFHLWVHYLYGLEGDYGPFFPLPKTCEEINMEVLVDEFNYRIKNLTEPYTELTQPIKYGEDKDHFLRVKF